MTRKMSKLAAVSQPPILHVKVEEQETDVALLAPATAAEPVPEKAEPPNEPPEWYDHANEVSL